MLLSEDNRVQSEREVEVSIHCLPIELKIRIFSFFTPQQLCRTVAPVCKEWFDISQDPSLWKELDIQFCDWNSRVEVAQHIRKILGRCTHLQSLTIRGKRWQHVLVKDTVGLTFTCPTLKALQVYGCTICRDFLDVLRLNSRSLEKLQIIDCNDSVDTKLFVSELSNLPKLKDLYLNHVTNWATQFEDDCLRTLAQNCTNLRRLWLANFQYITDESIRDMVIWRKNSLREVQLDGRNITSLAVFSDCPYITHLSLQFAQDITDETFLAISTLKLKELELNWKILLPHQKNIRVSSKALMDFVTNNCRVSMTRLGLHGFEGFNDQVLNCVSGACPNLTWISFQMCDDVTDVGLKFLISLEHLKGINMSYCNKITLDAIKLFPKTVSIIDFTADM